MPKQRKINITKKNIPLIMEAVKNYGDLPTLRSETILTVFEILLHISSDNIANIKMAHLSKMTNCSTSLIANKLKTLERYGFIENITPKGEVASVWKINLPKLQLTAKTYLIATKLQKELAERKKKN